MLASWLSSNWRIHSIQLTHSTMFSKREVTSSVLEACRTRITTYSVNLQRDRAVMETVPTRHQNCERKIKQKGHLFMSTLHPYPPFPSVEAAPLHNCSTQTVRTQGWIHYISLSCLLPSLTSLSTGSETCWSFRMVQTETKLKSSFTQLQTILPLKTCIERILLIWHWSLSRKSFAWAASACQF